MKLNFNLKYVTRRFLAYIIDWYVGGMLISLPITFKAMEMNPGVQVLSQRLDQFPVPLSVMVGISSIVIGIVYYLIVPSMVWPGQTLGKKITKLKIVSLDGNKLKFLQLFMRQVVGIILIEGSIYNVTAVLHQLLTILLAIDFNKVLGPIGFVITCLSVLYSLFNKNNQAIHDLISKTKVEANV